MFVTFAMAHSRDRQEGGGPPSRTAESGDPRGSDVTDQLPLVIAVVLNWNNLPDTLECVESVLRSDYSNFRVLVVDNGSREDPSTILRVRYPDVRVLRNQQNLGYGGGNNSGIRYAMDEGAAYVLLLNNDVTVAPDTIRRLVAAAEGDSRIGLATPRVFYYDRPTEVYWDGGIVDWETGDTPHDSSRLPVEAGLKKSEWLDGCSLLVRASTMQDIGLLDERYFLYFEDTEWSVRASRRGWMNAVVLQARVWHKVSRSTGGLSTPAVRFYYVRNRYLFMRAHRPSSLGSLWKLRYAWRICSEYLALRDELESREAVIAAFVSLLRRRWGPYEPNGDGRRFVRALDALLMRVTKVAGPIKRFLLGSGRVAR
jgi:hypothetical protein